MDDYEKLTIPQLRLRATREGLNIKGKRKKAEIIAVLRNAKPGGIPNSPVFTPNVGGDPPVFNPNDYEFHETTTFPEYIGRNTFLTEDNVLITYETFIGDSPISMDYSIASAYIHDNYEILVEKFNLSNKNANLSRGQIYDLLWWTLGCVSTYPAKDIARNMSKAAKSTTEAIRRNLEKFSYNGPKDRLSLIFAYATGIKSPGPVAGQKGKQSYDIIKDCKFTSINDIIDVFGLRRETEDDYAQFQGTGPYQLVASQYGNIGVKATHRHIPTDGDPKIYLGEVKFGMKMSKNSSFVDFCDTLKQYSKCGIFTRDVSVLQNFPDPDVVRTFGNLMGLPYTNRELMERYGATKPSFKTRGILVNNILGSGTYPRWSLASLNCANDEYTDPIEFDTQYKDIPRNYDWVSYGEPGNWRCYTMSSLVENFQRVSTTDAGGTIIMKDTAEFYVADATMPNQVPFRDGTKLGEFFTPAQAKQLRLLLKSYQSADIENLNYFPLNTNINIAAIKQSRNMLVKYLDAYLQRYGEHEIFLNSIKSKYDQLEPQEKIGIVNLLLITLMTGLVMRRWKGPKSIYPMSWEEFGYRDNNRAKDDERELFLAYCTTFFNESMRALETGGMGNAAVFFKTLILSKMLLGTDEFRTYTVATRNVINYKLNGNTIVGIMEMATPHAGAGKFCLAEGNMFLISSAYVYLTNMIGYTPDQISRLLNRYWMVDDIRRTWRIERIPVLFNGSNQGLKFDIKRLNDTGHMDPDAGYLLDELN